MMTLHPRPVRSALLALAAATMLPGMLPRPGLAATGPTGPDADPPTIRSSTDQRACQFAIRADNNIGEDVWILFTQSTVIVQRANFFSTEFKDMSNRRLAPGEKLNARFKAPGACGAPRFWGMTVRIGGRGGEIISIWRETEGSTDRTVHLGTAACWAVAQSPWWEDADEDRVVETDDEAFGCDPENTRYGLAPAPESDEPVADEPPAGETGDEATGGPGLPAGVSLESNWLRVGGNNPRNNGIRVLVEGDRATLVHKPPQASNAFSVGQVLWQGISANGRLEVRGSNGRYYPATIVMEGSDRLNIDIDDDPGPGYEQTWERAGPSIDGDWVLVDATDSANEGLQLRVRGDRATLLFVPPTAPRFLRVGDELWRRIGAGEQLHLGRLEALSSGRRHETAQFRLVDEKQLRVVFDAGGGAQLWVRPNLAERMKAAEERTGSLPQQPVDDPMEAGRDLQGPDEERTVDVPEELPPPAPEPEEEAACLATSLRHDAMDVRWGWGLSASTPLSDLPNSVLPEYEGVSQRYDMVVDIDRSVVSGLGEHHSYLWQDNVEGRLWKVESDLTSREYHDKWVEYDEAGFRPTDVEAYMTPNGLRYSGVWVSNPEGIEWWSRRNMTDSAYHQSYVQKRADGYRLVDVEAYRTSNGLRYAAIWHKSCDNTNWRQWRNMTRGSYQAKVDSLGDLGFQVVDFESYPGPSGQWIAAIWEKVSSRAWRVRSGRTLKQFLNLHRRYTDQGFRLVDYESYETANGPRYAGVWGENDPRYRYTVRAAIDDTIRAYRDTNFIPGMSVVIIQDGDVVYRRGFGTADRESGKESHAKTVYLAASVSKVIGATLAAKLEEEGHLDLSKRTATYLDQPAINYLDLGFAAEDACRNNSEGVCSSLPDRHTHTVEQLLAKTSCVHHYDEGPRPDNTKTYRFRAEALFQIWDAPLLSARGSCTPGRHYRYSTHGFTYVGAVLEAVMDKDMSELLRDELAQPFGLPSMRAMFTEDASDGLAPNYDRAAAYNVTSTSSPVVPHPVNNPTIPVDYENNSWKVLGGGIEIHALDLARFGWKLLNGKIVSDSVRNNRLWSSLTDSATAWVDTVGFPPDEPPPLTPTGVPSGGVGLAWVLGGTTGSSNGRWVRHGGDARGAGSYLKIWRDRGLVIAMLSNRRYHNNMPGNDRNNLLDTLATLVLSASPP